MTNALLVLNAGSSSIRCALYECSQLGVLCRGHIEAIGTQRQKATWSGALAMAIGESQPSVNADHAMLSAWLLETLRERLPDVTIAAVGHRVVHGGTLFSDPVVIDAAVLAGIEQLIPLAPNHEPRNLAAIRAVGVVWPDLMQVACFDTAFHRGQPRVAQLFALPRELSDAGILRYGFHGLSYEYLAGELPEIAGARADGRVILAHLGHGASLCALHGRRNVATTMGFSALDGLMMGTRCGAIDPGVLVYLQQSRQLGVDALIDLLYNRSGLLGVSAISDDLRTLEASSDERALEAIELFAYRATCEAGALTAALGGLDVLVFSAGIGENSAQMRALICARLSWLGIELDAQANAAHRTQISNQASRVDVYVIPTDEEVVIARATRKYAGRIAMGGPVCGAKPNQAGE